MAAIWEVTPEKIEEAVRRIIRVAGPRRVILFGSAARGETQRDSDADFLVVTGDDCIHPGKESDRIYRALHGLMMPVDVIVVSESRLNEYRDTPGLVYRKALQEGIELYNAGA